MLADACVGDAEDQAYVKWAVDALLSKQSKEFKITGMTGHVNGHYGTGTFEKSQNEVRALTLLPRPTKFLHPECCTRRPSGVRNDFPGNFLTSCAARAGHVEEKGDIVCAVPPGIRIRGNLAFPSQATSKIAMIQFETAGMCTGMSCLRETGNVVPF